jgi:hypothetical protein
VRACHSEKFLEMIFGWSCLALEVAFSCRYALLTRVTDFLIATTIADHYGYVMGLSLWPFLATLGTFPDALNGGLGWCGLVIISCHACVA